MKSLNRKFVYFLVIEKIRRKSLTFLEFFEIVEKSLKLANAKCADEIREAFSQMQQMMQTLDGRRELVKIFK